MSLAHPLHREELINALTHGVGAFASAAAGAVLITLAALWGDAWQLGTAIVFVVTLLLLYIASTLYHAARHEQLKQRLKVLDHCAIFLLIAGTYTPFTLLGLRDSWGWTLFAMIWALAVLGVVFKLFFTGRFPRLSTMMYVAMGWLIVIAFGPMVQELSTATIAWL
ncbi:MAG: PAQR family membrane homeostasis protein TrhA, partial [Aquimonas sp.]